MYVKIHDFRQHFLLLALLATTSLAAMLFFANIINNNNYYLSYPFANATDTRNSTRHLCFTVGFRIPTTGNGLGNHLFFYAGTMYVAWTTGRKPLILTSPERPTELDRAFKLNIARQNHQNACSEKYYQEFYVYAYNSDIEKLTNVDANVSVRLEGAFCSWKYTQPIEDQLRRKLQFHEKLTKFASTFLSSSVPHGWNISTFVRVGVHVRRGDYLGSWAMGHGFTVASLVYLKHAMAYFVDRHSMVQFVVASDDIDWCRESINASWFSQERVNITFSIDHSAEQDLVLLASCNHTIMTTGTYSWWAAFLANGTTVYYKHWPRHGSWLWQHSRPAEFFYPTWIAMD